MTHDSRTVGLLLQWLLLLGYIFISYAFIAYFYQCTTRIGNVLPSLQTDNSFTFAGCRTPAYSRLSLTTAGFFVSKWAAVLRVR